MSAENLEEEDLDFLISSVNFFRGRRPMMKMMKLIFSMITTRGDKAQLEKLMRQEKGDEIIDAQSDQKFEESCMIMQAKLIMIKRQLQKKSDG